MNRLVAQRSYWRGNPEETNWQHRPGPGFPRPICKDPRVPSASASAAFSFPDDTLLVDKSPIFANDVVPSGRRLSHPARLPPHLDHRLETDQRPGMLCYASVLFSPFQPVQCPSLLTHEFSSYSYGKSTVVSL